MKTFSLVAAGVTVAAGSIIDEPVVAGTPPTCVYDAGTGRTHVYYTRAVHESFKCTHTISGACTCVEHPTHRRGSCKQVQSKATGKILDYAGDCSDAGKDTPAPTPAPTPTPPTPAPASPWVSASAYTTTSVAASSASYISTTTFTETFDNTRTKSPTFVEVLGADEALISFWSGSEKCIIHKLTISTGALTHWAGSSCGNKDGASGIAQFKEHPNITVKNGIVLVADSINGSVRQIDPTTRAVTTLATGFWHPKDVEIVGDYAYVTDSHNRVISKVNISTGAVERSFAGTWGDMTVRDGINGSFSCPFGIAKAGTEESLLVVDGHAHIIRKIDLSTGEITTIAGTANSAGSADGTGGNARFNQPRYIAVDGDVAMITDASGNTIRRLEISTGAVTTIATGALNAGGNIKNFKSPWGITMDAEKVLVADFNQERVVRITPTQVT